MRVRLHWLVLHFVQKQQLAPATKIPAAKFPGTFSHSPIPTLFSHLPSQVEEEDLLPLPDQNVGVELRL